MIQALVLSVVAIIQIGVIGAMVFNPADEAVVDETELGAAIWYPQSNYAKLVNPLWGVEVTSLANCNTIDTNALGRFTCGTDEGGSAGAVSGSGSVGALTYWTASTTIAATGSPSVGSIHATNTLATSTFPNVSVSGAVSLLGEYITNFTSYVRGLFTGGTGIAITSGDVTFDCSEVEGTGINCSGENITLDATGDWTGTLDLKNASDFILVGTTSVGSITGLPNLSITESQISDLDHYTDSDIDGNESAFTGWDKNASDDWATTSADYWAVNNLTLSELSDVEDGSAWGQLLMWTGSVWSTTSTSSLGISGGGGDVVKDGTVALGEVALWTGDGTLGSNPLFTALSDASSITLSANSADPSGSLLFKTANGTDGGSTNNFTISTGSTDGGASGDISFRSGTVSSSTSASAAGGVTVAGGSTNGSGDGGWIDIYGGDSVGGAGGDVYITAGGGATNGSIMLGNAGGGGYATLYTLDMATDHIFTFPNKDGTFALLDDVWATSSADYWETTQTARTADDLSDNTTTDLSEGTNLYFTDSRVGDYITASSTLCEFLTGSADLCDGIDSSGSGGTGLATSTPMVDTYVVYGTSPSTVGAESAFTYDDATDKLTVVNASTTYTTANTFFGNLTGLASLATALNANGSNCSTGSFPLGVNASGAAEDCTDAWTEAENTSAAYISRSGVSASYPISYNNGTGVFSWLGLSTSTAPTIGGMPYWTSPTAFGTVATGTLTENVTGLEFSATGSLVGSAAVLGLTTGYGIPLTASTTNWNDFYVTPSGRISAGDGLTWNVNTLNFDGGATPAGALGGTWASPTVDDDGHNHTSTTISGIDISADTNLAVTYPVVRTDDTLSLAFGTTTANNWSLLQNFMTATATNLEVVTGINLFGGGLKTTANALCIQLTGSADLCDGADAEGGGSGWATTSADYWATTDLKLSEISDVQDGNAWGNMLYWTGSLWATTSTSTLGLGNVFKSGTPVDNQIGVWTGDGTIEGDAGLTFDGGLNVTVADTENKVGLSITNNDTTNNPASLQITSGTYGGILKAVSTRSAGGHQYIIFSHEVTNATSLGGLDFRGNNSADASKQYGQVLGFSTDTTAGAEDGKIALHVMNNGNSSSEIFYVDGNGVNGINVGRSSAAGVVSSNGSNDLTLQTGNTTTGNITITDGANGNITASPNGTGQFVVSGASTTLASTTISGNLSFAGVLGDAWSDFCVSITGGSALCDGTDDTGTDSADDLTNNSIEDLNDVAAITENYGDLLGWSGTAWTDFATSSLGISWSDLRSVPAGFSDGVDNTGLGTSTPWTAGQLASVVNNGTLTSVATGTLTETVTGLEFDATRALVGGGAVLGITTGYGIPLTASTTNWNDFYVTPSNRITAGTGIDWSANTLNVGGLTTSEFTSANVSQWTNNANYIDWLDLSATYPLSYNSGTGAFSWIGLATSTSLANTNIIYGTAPGTIGSESAFTYDSSTDRATVVNASTTNLSVATAIELFGGGAKTTANALCIQLTGSADLCDGGDAEGGGSGWATTSADYWATTDLKLSEISDVQDGSAWGNMLYWTGSLWATTSTSTLGLGDVRKVGTPVDGQIGVWTGDGTIEGTSVLTTNGTSLLLDNTTSVGLYTDPTYAEIYVNDATSNSVIDIFAKDGSTLISLEDTGTTALGPYLNFVHNSASPAANDAVGRINFYGEDSASNAQQYGQISAILSDPTSTSEDGTLKLRATVAGTLTDILAASASGVAITGTTTASVFTATDSGSTSTLPRLSVTSGIELFAGGVKTTANALCIQLTGSAALCDGDDASAGGLSGGSTNALTYWTSDTTIGATSSPTVGYITATSTTGINRFAATTSVQNIGGVSSQHNLWNDADNPTVGLSITDGMGPVVLTGLSASGISIYPMDGPFVVGNSTGISLNDAVTALNGISVTGYSTTSQAFIAQSSTATSSLPRTSITTAFNFLGDYITNVTTWFDSKVEALTSVVMNASAAWDFGGATSLEIPNGTGNTVDAAGECAWDTSDDQMVCGDSGNTARVVATDEFRILNVTVSSTSIPFISTGNLAVNSFKDGLEITQFRCYVISGTSFSMTLTDGTNATESITCGTTVTSDTDVATNDTFTADEIMYLDFGTKTGTVDYVHFEAYARITRE